MIKPLALSLTPTPLHPLERLSEDLGVEIWIKRDDLTGSIVTGGNKIRKLGYIMADALAQEADTVLTTGGPQSNHAKATAAVAVQVGLKPVLVLAGRDPGQRRANLFFNHLLGADIRFSGARTAEEMEAALEEAYQSLVQEGHRPYLIPIGGSNGLGALGYVDAYQELGEHDFDLIVVTAGSGGTFAGLFLANERAGRYDSTRILGISPWLPAPDIADRIKRCIYECEPAWEEKELLLDDAYIGPGYGKLTAEAQAAIINLARLEAIILDHVYTGKAMAALIDYIETGKISPNEKVLFWHTGGAPGLLAIQDRFF
ncbi:D-cysteine desulfhydrase family pyridoxal phosphate-dependent enzyme [Caldalkalibacillus uzonensis]|uniref:D-cysteine desulfhydrase family pyridoxal phosphate-dependent enzyme n=1 Tax=Caldalkalibacillus uzonensis TaxID=353224 RepID=A0ABU0CV28_9BACI|nr:D-cysteine desulfhydrase family protein [Caldalkalibacillus uzonensis]MDQ0339360.1 D-cysteine desulfhydrase family pyridoxal phosphate-dependent enzyme [Caldalkalibacillus uzonensis]